MQPSVNESMRDALVRAVVLVGRASEAAGGVGASGDAVVVTQRVHAVQAGLSLVDPESFAAASLLVDDTLVTPSLVECRRCLVDAAGVLDGAVRSEPATLLPAGLLTVRADLADTIRVVQGLEGCAP